MLKKFVNVVRKISIIICLVGLWMYYVDHVNDEEIARMRAEIPAVVSMDGTETLTGKMKMLSRSRGYYLGRCYIDEHGSEKEITNHYKREFGRHGWKYIGRFNWKDAYPSSHTDERYYYFEKEGDYCIYLCLNPKNFNVSDRHKVEFSIRVKKDYDNRKYCKIEDE